MSAKEHRVGLISDTHGLVRAEALDALRGVELILHAGDVAGSVGGADVVEALETVAPVVAVRGNNDRGAWARELPERVTVEVGGRRIHVLHDVAELDLEHAGAVDVVVFGHSHRPARRWEGGVLYLNPGSAGPRRFTLPVSVSLLTIRGERLETELVRLESV